MATSEPTAAELDLLSEGALKIDEAMRESGLGRSALYDRMADGSLPFVALSRRKRVIPRRGLRLFLARNLRNGPAQG